MSIKQLLLLIQTRLAPLLYGLLSYYITLATTAYAYQNKLHSGWIVSTGAGRGEQFPATINPNVIQ